MLWDSGIPDSVATMPNGFVTGGGTLTYRLPKPFRAQLAEIGVSPEQVTHIAFSHTHGDHVGNANLFTRATLFIQQAEYDAAFGPDAAKYGFQSANYAKLRDNPTVPLRGDHDVFGDGSVVILSTPGHTPGHQSLLVRMAKTGTVILSGDAAHFRDNWENRRVPSMNTDRDQTLASLQRIADLLAQNKAELWINHDKPQSDAYRRPPQYYD